MGIITTTEQALINATETAFNNTLKAVKPVPGPITIDVLKQMISVSPAVHVAFLGGAAQKDVDAAYMDGRWTAYITSKNAGGGLPRLHGDATEIGIYEIVERLVPTLHDLNIEDVGTCQFLDVKNLFSIQLQEKLGAALWAVVFNVPMPFPDDFDPASLADFLTFHGESDINGDGDYDTTHDFELPQN